MIIQLTTFAFPQESMKLELNRYLLLLLLPALLLVMNSCLHHKEPNLHKLFDNKDLESKVKYAVGFDYYQKEDVTKLVIYIPGKNKDVLSTYYLVNEDKELVQDPSHDIVYLPVDSFAVFSATQLNAFFVLNELDKVVAISESDFIQNKKVRSLYESGKITNLASNGNFFLEKALEVNPEIVFYSPWNLAQRHPLAETHLRLIPFFDFMETNPLGRAEWLKFTALFTNSERQADSIFNEIEKRYTEYSSLTDSLVYKPTVFSDKYYSGQWFIPGGKSYIAQLLSDAGADYLWKSNSNTASVNLDFEVVYQKAHKADFWRIIGHYDNDFSYETLLAENDLYANFEAFKERRVVFCDSRKTTYFETGTLEPHIVLADLIFAFHPELLPDHKPVYYKHYR